VEIGCLVRAFGERSVGGHDDPGHRCGSKSLAETLAKTLARMNQYRHNVIDKDVASKLSMRNRRSV
jgi:hypothetical protein